MILGVSGHQNLGGAETVRWVRSALLDALKRTLPELGLTSLAVGSDQLFASLLLEKQIAYDAIIPCDGYESTFGDDTLRRYRELLASARREIRLGFPLPSEQAFWSAGQQVVDRSDILIAIWDGQDSRGLGGTADVVNYAIAKGHSVVHIDPVRRITSPKGLNRDVW